MQSTLKKIGIIFLGFAFLALPLYLLAETVSLHQQIESLRTTYPKLTDEEIAVVQAVKNTKPSVVSVVIREEVFRPSERWVDLGNGFRFLAPGESQSGGKQVVGQGSGFVVRSDGLIMTNKHVVAGKNAEYQVVFHDGRTFDAKVVVKDPLNDVALLKVDVPTGTFPTLPLGDSKNLEIGQTVVAIGNALGELQNSVTKGIVSAMNRVIVAADRSNGSTERLVRIIQTDAAINPGNSGGPLLNTNGEVIAMNTAVNEGAENVGFAIPVDDLKFVIQSYEQNGAVARPFLGVRYAPVTKEVKQQMNVPYERGVILIAGENGEPSVLPGSPAASAGLKEGDVILVVNGVVLNEKNDLATVVRDLKVGQTLTMRVWKKSLRREVTIKIKLAEMK